MIVQVLIFDTDGAVGDTGEIFAEDLPAVFEIAGRGFGRFFDIMPLQDWDARLS